MQGSKNSPVTDRTIDLSEMSRLSPGNEISARLRVTADDHGERTYLVAVTVGSTTSYLRLDDAREAVDQLYHRVHDVIALAEEITRRRDELLGRDAADQGSPVVHEPAGDADDGVISGRRR